MVLFSRSPRSVEPEQAAEIFREAGPYTARVCVSHTRSASDLSEILSLSPTAIQISEPLEITGPCRPRVIRVVTPGSPLPDPLTTDAVIVDASRGRGRVYDPVFAREIMRQTPLPVILAGGLSPENVADAIQTIRPYAVDVASGTESSPGIKDPERLRAFIRNARIQS